jgi:succinoglycan biosynthesis transport protein ExoP
LTANARAVVVPDTSMTEDARKLMADQLRVVGFSEIDMLSEPARPSNASEPVPQVVAA